MPLAPPPRSRDDGATSLPLPRDSTPMLTAEDGGEHHRYVASPPHPALLPPLTRATSLRTPHRRATTTSPGWPHLVPLAPRPDLSSGPSPSHPPSHGRPTHPRDAPHANAKRCRPHAPPSPNAIPAVGPPTPTANAALANDAAPRQTPPPSPDAVRPFNVPTPSPQAAQSTWRGPGPRPIDKFPS